MMVFPQRYKETGNIFYGFFRVSLYLSGNKEKWKHNDEIRI
jgi:hypothetical protein